MGARNYSGKMGGHLACLARASDPTACVHTLAKPAVMGLGVLATSARTARTPVLPDNPGAPGEQVCNPELNTGSCYATESDSKDINPCL
jgi:hypothetical protein